MAIRDASQESEYVLGTRTATFHTCARCGVVPVVTSRIDDRIYAVVSVNAFEGVEPTLVRRLPANFDGEDTDARLARRKRNWIANVEWHVATCIGSVAS